MLLVLCLCLMSATIVIIQSKKFTEVKYAKSLNYVLNQNVVNVTKREKLATFTMRVVDNRPFA